MRVIAALFTAVLVLLPAHAAHSGAGATFAASYKLDPAPAWQTSAQKSESGSWVKHSSPVVADLGDGPVIVVADQGGRVSVLRYAGGQLTEVWNTGSVIETFIDSSPAVGDLNGDGCPEVVVGAGNEFRPHDSGLHVFDCHGQNHRFWPAPVVPDKANHVGVFSTPAIGDVSGDGRPDIVYGSFNQKIYAKDANGLDLPGWPRENYDTVWSSAALGDVDGDGVREIAIGTDLGGGAPVFGCNRGVRGTVSIFEGDGSYRPNFPRCVDTPIWSTPVLQDVTGDGGLDVIVASNNYLEGGAVVGDPRWIRAWDARTGAQHWATQVATGARMFASPAVGDVGGDGTLDIAIGTIQDPNYGEVYLLDARTGAIRWHHEGGHHDVCACHFMGSPVLADVDGDGKDDVVAASQDGGLNAWNLAGHAIIDDLHPPPPAGFPEWETGASQFFNSPAIADLDGDGRNEIVLASADRHSDPLRGMVWVVETQGKGTGSWPFFKRDAARTSSSGRSASAPPPISPPTAPPPAAKTTTPATPTPSPTPEPTASPTADPTASPTAEPPTPSPTLAPEPDEGAPWVLVGSAAGGVLALLAAGVVLWIRRRASVT